MIIFLTGPSGVGKSHLSRFYYNYFGYTKTLSINTRQYRESENEPFRQVSEEIFFLLKEDKLCLVAKNHGYWYGYIKEEIINERVNIIEVDTDTAVKEKEKFNAKIIRVISPKDKFLKIIENIIIKNDFLDLRFQDLFKQMNRTFLKKRVALNDIIFENRFDKESENRFVKKVLQIAR